MHYTLFFSHIIIKFQNKICACTRAPVCVCVADHCYCATNKKRCALFHLLSYVSAPYYLYIIITTGARYWLTE